MAAVEQTYFSTPSTAVHAATNASRRSTARGVSARALDMIMGMDTNVIDAAALTSTSISSPVLGASRTVNCHPPRHIGVGFGGDF
jgi:hypothetical protein